MEVLELIQEAERAGLAVEAEGDQLIVRGPKAAAAIARQLGERKADVLAALRSDWAADARALIAVFQDESLRADLTDLYQETAATLEFSQGNPRERAEMLAFGQLMFHLLCLGVSCPTARGLPPE